MKIKASQRLKLVNRKFDPYLDRSDLIRLDRNEDPVGFDEDHLANFLASISPHDIAAYADSEVLVNKLASWLKVSSENIYVTAGSDAAIKNIFETYIDYGDNILIQDPCWRMYEVYSNIYGANQIKVPYSKNLEIDVSKIIKIIKSGNIKLLALANPNQPTGTIFIDSEIEEILRVSAEENVIVLMDEAYHLFSNQTAIQFVEKFDNLIVVRTFSKAFGLAGLRVGYCVANPSRINELKLLRPVTDANSLGLKCAVYVLNNINWIKSRIESFISGRNYIFKNLTLSGIHTFPSHGNFLLVKCNSQEDSVLAVKAITERGYVLKPPFNFAPLENCIRIGIGPLQLMEKFWEDCAPILKKYGKKTIEN